MLSIHYFLLCCCITHPHPIDPRTRNHNCKYETGNTFILDCRSCVHVINKIPILLMTCTQHPHCQGSVIRQNWCEYSLMSVWLVNQRWPPQTGIAYTITYIWACICDGNEISKDAPTFGVSNTMGLKYSPTLGWMVYQDGRHKLEYRSYYIGQCSNVYTLKPRNPTVMSIFSGSRIRLR